MISVPSSSLSSPVLHTRTKTIKERLVGNRGGETKEGIRYKTRGGETKEGIRYKTTVEGIKYNTIAEQPTTKEIIL